MVEFWSNQELSVRLFALMFFFLVLIVFFTSAPLGDEPPPLNGGFSK